MSSLGDRSSHVTLEHTLKLLSALRELASSNLALSEIWKERRDVSFETVRDLFLAPAPGELVL